MANARTLERVPAGARFRVRLVVDILCPEDRELLARLGEGLRLLEDDALGGGGSRGSGRVKFTGWKATWRAKAYYAAGAAEAAVLQAADTAELQAGLVAAEFAEKLS
jgi:CRISPR-associated protein Csm3